MYSSLRSESASPEAADRKLSLRRLGESCSVRKDSALLTSPLVRPDSVVRRLVVSVALDAFRSDSKMASSSTLLVRFRDPEAEVSLVPVPESFLYTVLSSYCPPIKLTIFLLKNVRE